MDNSPAEIQQKACKHRRLSEDDAHSAVTLSAGLPSDFRQQCDGQEDIEDIWKLHEIACAANKDFYTDPSSGYKVFTKLAHERRGKCCGSGCRHCPFAYENVDDQKLAARMQQPAFLHVAPSECNAALIVSDPGVVVLFWSSGKDSFLTLRALKRTTQLDVILVTTFDASSRLIAHQEVNIDQVQRQAEHLGISLVGIPLHAGVEYLDRIKAGLAVIQKKREIVSLAFGDLHLEHIRSWREDRLCFDNTGIAVRLYPLWHVPYEELLADLEQSRVPCEVCALGGLKGDPPSFLKVGVLFDRALNHQLPAAGIDAFGEEGEFHTLAKVWEVPRQVALG